MSLQDLGDTPVFTPGSVMFTGSDGKLAEDNPNFFWDDTNNELEVSKVITSNISASGDLSLNPASKVLVGGESLVVAKLNSQPASASTGQIYYDKALKQFRGYNGVSWTGLGETGLIKHFQTDTGGTLTTNLNAYWKLDETSGTRSDFWSTNYLTDNNTVGSATGIQGNSANFVSANSEYLSVSDSASNSTGGEGAFAYAGWFLWNTGASGQDCILTKAETSGADAVDICIGRVTANRLSCVSNSSQSVVYASDISQNVWHFFICNYDMGNNTISISVDGSAFTNNTSATEAQLDGDNVFEIGANNAVPASFFDGKIDEIGFWKGKILSSPERDDLWSGGSGQTMVED